MQLSAEVRLWWQGAQCGDVEAWFEALSNVVPGGPPRLGGGGGSNREPSPEDARKDMYLRDPEQRELGIKVRGLDGPDPQLEAKSLVGLRGDVVPFGTVTLWTKTSSRVLAIGSAPTILTYKWRRLRKYGWDGSALEEIELGKDEKPLKGFKPDAGCNAEFTRVTVMGMKEVWWTLGYEAFGKLEDVERILRLCLQEAISRGPLPASEAAEPGSYPEWLGRVAGALRA